MMQSCTMELGNQIIIDHRQVKTPKHKWYLVRQYLPTANSGPSKITNQEQGKKQHSPNVEQFELCTSAHDYNRFWKTAVQIRIANDRSGKPGTGTDFNSTDHYFSGYFLDSTHLLTQFKPKKSTKLL